MCKHCFLLILLFALATENLCSEVPPVTLEAYKPKGFRVSVPAVEGLQLFAFHGNINKAISQVEPGEISKDVRQPENNFFIYYDANLVLKEGDILYYWVFVQKDKLGYRLDHQQWTVTELLTPKDSSCIVSKTLVTGKSEICENTVVFEDHFNNSDVDTRKWTIEQYIPASSPDFEFVTYRNNKQVLRGSNGILFIRPKPIVDEKEVRGQLDLRHECTREIDTPDCLHVANSVFIIPPVISGRIVSKFSFLYGKIEIRAKLPSGDWIFPQIYLEQEHNSNRKLVLAYARGNERLTVQNGKDIGGHLLFGGAIVQPEEPERSTYLLSKYSDKTFTNDMHTYTVVWTKASIELSVDGQLYGKIDGAKMDELKFSENDMVKVVLGVGVGGINDFPDESLSGSQPKPWKNRDRALVKNFFKARDNWSATWKGDQSALQVDYVKITSL